MQDLYIPRRQYLQTIKEISNCPDCDELLVEEESTIMLYGKSDVDEGEFMSNLSGSHFCHNCPVVVFEKETIEQAITTGLKIKEVYSYAILGLVDLDSIPEEKRQSEIGTDDNPIPLIEFLDDLDAKPKTIRPQTSNKNKLNRKIGRNEPCPCGSGEKYKKCCI